jgi:ABC-type antimicrobial peptide transport system permease subunit
VLGRGLLMAASGVAIGAGVAFLLGRAVSVLLYDVKPTDPLTFIAGGTVLLAVASVASYIPARRATTVDPVVALKAQ